MVVSQSHHIEEEEEEVVVVVAAVVDLLLIMGHIKDQIVVEADEDTSSRFASFFFVRDTRRGHQKVSV